MNQLINFWLPQTNQPNEKIPLLIKSCYVASLFLFLNAIIYTQIDYPIGIAFMVFTLLLVAIVLVLIKRGSSYLITGNGFTFGVYFVVLGITVTSADVPINSSMISWFIMMPISAFLYVNKTAAKIWLGISIATILALYGASLWNVPSFNQLPAEATSITAYNIRTYLILMLYLFTVVNIYERQRSRHLHSIKTSLIDVENKNEEILQQKEEILAINQALEGQNQELVKTHQLLEKQNQKTTDSLRYAHTIQQAILPSQEKMNSIFTEHFIIYKAKAIVSGDFYWIERLKNSIYICLADCTGHGVPGAFMSIIGYSLLNDIIIKRKIDCPSKVLEYMDKGIKRILQQATNNNQDGMDIALCKCEYVDDQIQLTYAGAKQHVYFAEPTQNTIKVLKGQKRSIGGTIRKQQTSFTTTQQLLPKGSSLYFSSDGLAHQHNEQRKKFTSSGLIQALTQVQGSALPQQKAQLELAIASFQGTQEQRDDITLLAFQL